MAMSTPPKFRDKGNAVTEPSPFTGPKGAEFNL